MTSDPAMCPPSGCLNRRRASPNFTVPQPSDRQSVVAQFESADKLASGDQKGTAHENEHQKSLKARAVQSFVSRQALAYGLTTMIRDPTTSAAAIAASSK